MIYLKAEREQFERTKKAFADAFKGILEGMWKTFEGKAKVRDVGSPIHHRQSPQEQVGMAKAKCRRLESIMSEDGWEDDPKALALVIEECGDAANYLTFVAALCSLLLAEEGKVTAGKMDLSKLRGE